MQQPKITISHDVLYTVRQRQEARRQLHAALERLRKGSPDARKPATAPTPLEKPERR